MLKENTSKRIYPHFTRSYFISTSTEVTFPFSSPLQIPQGENGVLSLYLRELQPGHAFVYILKKSQRKFHDSTVGFMLTRPWQTHPDASRFLPHRDVGAAGQTQEGPSAATDN